MELEIFVPHTATEQANCKALSEYLCNIYYA